MWRHLRRADQHQPRSGMPPAQRQQQRTGDGDRAASHEFENQNRPDRSRQCPPTPPPAEQQKQSAEPAVDPKQPFRMHLSLSASETDRNGTPAGLRPSGSSQAGRPTFHTRIWLKYFSYYITECLKKQTVFPLSGGDSHAPPAGTQKAPRPPCRRSGSLQTEVRNSHLFKGVPSFAGTTFSAFSGAAASLRMLFCGFPFNRYWYMFSPTSREARQISG